MSEVGVLEEKEDIQRVLEKYNYEAVIFNVSENIKELIQFIENEKIDLIFNLVEGLGEESIHEMHIAGIYDLLGKIIPVPPLVHLASALIKQEQKKFFLIIKF